jgi:flagellar motility protein MotE (MotC chaperone)
VNIRLLPIVLLSTGALLGLKTMGLVTNGGYVLTGVTPVMAAGGGGGDAGGTVVESDATLTLPTEPTLDDISPVLSDADPTLGESAGGGHGAAAPEDHAAAPAEGAESNGELVAPAPQAATVAAANSSYCFEADVTLTEDGVPPAEEGGHGEAAPSSDHAAAAEGEAHAEAQAFAETVSTDCLPSGDAVPLQMNTDGTTSALVSATGATPTEQQLLERLATRRTELEQREQDLTLRTSIVEAAEQRIAERAATLEALEAQIASLVDQRAQMEEGQFAGIVLMYEAMKPKDAAAIFDNLDMEVLLRVAKTMSPRKMAPILSEMNANRAQELTVRMAALADQPVTEMTPADFSALPQIVGQ